jgi:hypothetical protein
VELVKNIGHITKKRLSDIHDDDTVLLGHQNVAGANVAVNPPAAMKIVYAHR